MNKPHIIIGIAIYINLVQLVCIMFVDIHSSIIQF
jgi:hypothetical protein